MSFSSVEDWDASFGDMPNTSRSTTQETVTGRVSHAEALPSQPYVPPPARMTEFGYPMHGPGPPAPPTQQYHPFRPDLIHGMPYAAHAGGPSMGRGAFYPPPQQSSTRHTAFGPPGFQPPRGPSHRGRTRDRGRTPMETPNRQSSTANYAAQSFARGREAGYSQSETQSLREDRDRLQRELNQSLVDRARLERELTASREENAYLNGQLHMLKREKGLPQSPQQPEAAFRKLSVSSVKSPVPSSSRKHSVSSPSHAQQGTDIKATLASLFADVEDWAKQHVTRAIDNLGQAPTFRDVAKRVLASPSFLDIAISPTNRKFLVAAIINEELLKVLGEGLLEEMHVFSSNEKVLELNSEGPVVPDNFEKQQGRLEKRAALVREISTGSGWAESAERKVDEMAGKIFTVFKALIPEAIHRRAFEELKILIRKALAAAVKLMAMPREWVISVAKKGERWEPHSMKQVDEVLANDPRPNNAPYLFHVRFGVRPSITEKTYGPNGQKVREVATKTVMLTEPTTPKKSPPKPLRGRGRR